MCKNIIFAMFIYKVYKYVLRRDDGHVLRKVLEFEVKGKKKRG